MIRPPVIVSMTRIGSTALPAVIDMRLMISAQATAPAAMPIITVREPKRVSSLPPTSAPTTPPRLKAVKPVLATAVPRPAPVRMDGSQEKPR